MLEVISHSTPFGPLRLILDQSGNLTEGYLFSLIKRVFGNLEVLGNLTHITIYNQFHTL